MIEKKLAIRPARPTRLTKPPIQVEPPYALESASTSGLPEALSASEPAPPGPTTRISRANASNTSIAPIRPRGRSRFGFLVSSAASGTPSTARKNQIA
ncbi:hypothetical protein D3C81_1716480 [compost metagenome]